MEVRIGLDGADLQRAQRDLLRGRGRAARDDHRARHPLGVLHRPLERALPPIEPPTTECPALDAEVVGERGLDLDLIADRDRPGTAIRTARPVSGSIDDGPVVP